ncbi:MLO-like protein 1 isoform X2 [Triticum aestivum]|nr:MLO-like protein 1 isoform X2 [Triticum aestivum]
MEGGGAGGEVDADALEYTPTWIVAGVCSLIVTISLAAERCLHYLGKTLKRKHQKALFEALLKVKEELMLLGFISLLMTVSQDVIQRTCIPPSWTNYLLPCKKMEEHSVAALGGRRLLPRNAPRSDHCRNKGKVPLLSLEALHQLHIFIFVLAITHVIFSVLTMVLGGAKIRQWKQWETEIHKNNAGNGPKKLTNVQQFEFIRERFNGVGMESTVLSWMHSFVKQFYASVTKSDYATMRLGFIMTHCRGNPKFGFHRYMVRALEADFKKVVGIRWYLWIFVVIFMLLNVNGWHTYFWISFLPLILLLAVGTKLEHVIAQLAHDVAEKHSAIEGDLVVNPSDEHFWCGKPRVILYLIHFILFQNAFEIALFFWILTTYGFNSCIMDHVPFIVPRLVIGWVAIHRLTLLIMKKKKQANSHVFQVQAQRQLLVLPFACRVVIQLLCSYSTLPLYAIVAQMGTFFNKEIFDEHIQQGLVGWAQKARMRTELSKDAAAAAAAGPTRHGASSRLEMLRRAAAMMQCRRSLPR